MDRRSGPRLSVDLSCRVNIPGLSAFTARVIDISKFGAGVCGGPSLPAGTRGTLHLESAGFALPFAVRDCQDDSLHLMFELDATTSARLGPIIERLVQNRAA
jgi:hypothetical protein